MSRDLSPAVELTLDDKPLRLRLDMTALLDFEQAAGMTVSELLRPLVGVMQTLLDDTGAASMEDLKNLPADERGAVGLRMLEQVLDSGMISVRPLLLLVWAMAGGDDLGETPREFGRRLSWANRAALVAAVTGALRNGFPEQAGDEAEGEPQAATGGDDEDPTPGLALSTTGQ